MAQFIGLTVSVTLKDPTGAKVRGLVTNVVEQRLSLSRGKQILESGGLKSLLITENSFMAGFWLEGRLIDRRGNQH